MLNALVLHGFKSFADKTRFDFPDGITVVVGPNGSGKSNIVDSIKWVLGEQSAKSLRGKEMADVIFKGSGDDARRAMNTAEATVVFDNSDSRLPIDAPEVSVTRRVYRSGEGEYLINGQPSRLRDVKDLFRGTGVGADSYSIIEQGKVGTLLQVSSRERRAIFEEAAGISRFKAKKVETQRRLERVDQNLLRLSDIVDEVESRLRSLRNQAGKARRYKENADRLRELRTQVGITDWRRLSGRLTTLTDALDRLSRDIKISQEESAALESRQHELENEVSNIDAAISGNNSQLGSDRENIAEAEATCKHQRQRVAEWMQRQQSARARLSMLNTRAVDLLGLVKHTERSLADAETGHARTEQVLQQAESDLASVEESLKETRHRIDSERDDHLRLLRHAAQLSNHITAAENEWAATETARQKQGLRIKQLEETLATGTAQRDRLREEEARLNGDVQEKSKLVKSLRDSLKLEKQLLDQHRRELAESKGQLLGDRQRAEVLEELERRQEGLGAGVREVLARRRTEPHGPFGEVCGLVADLVQVDVETAPLVEAALGERAHYVVLAGDRMIGDLQSGQLRLPGVVGILPLEEEPLREVGPNLSEQEGVVGPVRQCVDTDPRFGRLIDRLLHATWLVKDLSAAMRLHQRYGDAVRLVTLAGELVERDGTLLVGTREASVGVISRRSQLRALRKRIDETEQHVGMLAAKTDQTDLRVQQAGGQLESLEHDRRIASDSLAEYRADTRQATELCEQMEKERLTLCDELKSSEIRGGDAATRLETNQVALKETTTRLNAIEQRQKADEQNIAKIESQQRALLREATEARVMLARGEQRLESLREQLSQYQSDQQERQDLLEEALFQIEESLREERIAQRAILQAGSMLAEMYLEREALEQATNDLSCRRAESAAMRRQLSGTAESLHHTLQEKQREHHTLELESGQIRSDRATMADRLRDDYGIELASICQEESSEEQLEREAMEAEIDDLRDKIKGIGAVNMDALGELEELESRFESLSTQYNDLVEAKDSLMRIIQKINADSRRMFSETLEEIRTNFQALFRRVFGGGMADLVLEEDVDVLEAGIEIIATPPGKQSLGISLLSGGEQALTAVTLLLAIFQFRPGPFCILDEVDGPLDEANIGRFIDILKEFLSWTKFIVVTHSKNTMSAADTLYGVTMQESGISKRVSVRFDDVSDDGHIRQEAIDRADKDDTNSDARGAA